MTLRERVADLAREVFGRWFLPGLAAVTVANLAIAPFVPPGGRPIRFRPSAELSVIAHLEPEPVGSRYGLYLVLADLGAGATMHASADGLLDEELVEALAGMTMQAAETGGPPGGSHGGSQGPADITGTYEDPSGAVRSYRIVDLPGEHDWTVFTEGATVVIAEMDS